MPLGGDRVIITLQTAVRDRGRWLVIAPVLSLCRRRNVDCGRLSGMTQQSLLTSVNDQDNISGWDMLSSRHDACGCRVLPLGSPDRGACHMSSGESGWSCSGQRYAPRVIRGRGPYISAFVFCVLFCAFVFYFFLLFIFLFIIHSTCPPNSIWNSHAAAFFLFFIFKPLDLGWFFSLRSWVRFPQISQKLKLRFIKTLRMAPVGVKEKEFP